MPCFDREAPHTWVTACLATIWAGMPAPVEKDRPRCSEVAVRRIALAISRSCHGLWLTDGRSTTHSGKSRVNYNKITYSQHGSDLESHGACARYVCTLNLSNTIRCFKFLRVVFQVLVLLAVATPTTLSALTPPPPQPPPMKCTFDTNGHISSSDIIWH